MRKLPKHIPVHSIWVERGSLPFRTTKRQEKFLMERDMPEVLHNRQTVVVFLPEADLPTRSRVVDMPRFESRKRMIDEMAVLEGLAMREELGMRPGTPEEVTHSKGNLVEKELAEKLKKFYYCF